MDTKTRERIARIVRTYVQEHLPDQSDQCCEMALDRLGELELDPRIQPGLVLVSCLEAAETCDLACLFSGDLSAHRVFLERLRAKTCRLERVIPCLAASQWPLRPRLRDLPMLIRMLRKGHSVPVTLKAYAIKRYSLYLKEIVGEMVIYVTLPESPDP